MKSSKAYFFLLPPRGPPEDFFDPPREPPEDFFPPFEPFDPAEVFFDPPEDFFPPRDEPAALRAVSATAFVALPAARAVERAAFVAERVALPAEREADLTPPLRLPPERRDEEDEEERRDLPLPLGLIMSAAVGLTPSTVVAAESSAVFATLVARSATSPATLVT